MLIFLFFAGESGFDLLCSFALSGEKQRHTFVSDLFKAIDDAFFHLVIAIDHSIFNFPVAVSHLPGNFAFNRTILDI